MKTIAALLFLCVNLPIWLYLMYGMLVRTHASELEMFLFYVYIPVCAVIGVITAITNKIK